LPSGPPGPIKENLDRIKQDRGELELIDREIAGPIIKKRPKSKLFLGGYNWLAA